MVGSLAGLSSIETSDLKNLLRMSKWQIVYKPLSNTTWCLIIAGTMGHLPEMCFQDYGLGVDTGLKTENCGLGLVLKELGLGLGLALHHFSWSHNLGFGSLYSVVHLGI